MTLYRVTVPVTLETYAHDGDTAAAVEQVSQAIQWRSTLAAPAPGVPAIGDAIAVVVDPDRNPELARALTVTEVDALRSAAGRPDGRVLSMRHGVRERLTAAGLAAPRHGSAAPGGMVPVFITDAGRRALLRHGTSGGRS